MTKNQKGFTLVELLVVIVIIGILAAGAIAIFSGGTDKAKIAAVKNDVAVLFSAQNLCVNSSTGSAAFFVAPSTHGNCSNIENLDTNNYVDAVPNNPWTNDAEGYTVKAVTAAAQTPGAVGIQYKAVETDVPNTKSQFGKGSCGSAAATAADTAECA